MATRKIKLKDQLGRVVRVPVAAPPKPTTAPAPAPQQPERQSPAATVWRLIREVPANLQKLAALAGAGFTARDAAGNWHQRSIAAGQGVDIENGDGVAGNPTVALAELEDEGGGELLRILRDEYGRVTGTSEAELADLANVADDEPNEGDVLTFKDGEWLPEAQQSSSFGNLDGGVPGSIYGGTEPIDGGGP